MDFKSIIERDMPGWRMVEEIRPEAKGERFFTPNVDAYRKKFGIPPQRQFTPASNYDAEPSGTVVVEATGPNKTPERRTVLIVNGEVYGEEG